MSKPKSTKPKAWMEGTVWLKSTDAKGRISYTEHRCWHVDNFIKGAHERALNEKGKVEQITEQEYKAATARRK